MNLPYKIIIPGDPRTKKNSQRIIHAGNRNIPIPSKAFENYQNACGWHIAQLHIAGLKIDYPINLKCVYYMGTKRRVDLCNLQEATCDILVHFGVLLDDNSQIVAGHDGSRVRYDKENPRVEITFEEIEG